MTDLRGGHFTFSSILGLLAASYFGSPSSSSSSISSSSINSRVSSSSSSSSWIRGFALPLAWTTIIYILVFGRYSRTLERRFGTSRYIQIYIFLGGCSSVIAQGLFSAVVLPYLISSSIGGGSSRITSNSNNNNQQNILSSAFGVSNWNPLLIALSTFVALRVPSSRRALSTLQMPILRNFVYPYSPILISSISVFLNQWMNANRILTTNNIRDLSSPGSSSGLMMTGVLLSTLCSIIPGIAAGSVLRFYTPLLSILNSVADSSAVQRLVDTVFRSGKNESYVRQQGAAHERQQRAQEFQDNVAANGRVGPAEQGAARNLLHGDTEEEQMRQALIASIRQQRQQQQQQQQRPPSANNSSAAPAASSAAASSSRATSMASNNNNNNNNSTGPMTADERQAIQFLKDMTGQANSGGPEEDQHLLGVLRSCNGDANQAAGLLLGGM